MSNWVLGLLLSLLSYNVLVAQESTLVQLSIGNEYIYNYEYKYHGGGTGKGQSFVLEITGDTLINKQPYYLVGLEGKVDFDFFPWLANGEQKNIKYLFKTDISSFGIFDLSADTVFYFDTLTNKVRYPDFSNVTENSARVDGFNIGSKESVRVFEEEKETWDFWINGFNIYRHDYNVFELSEYFGLTSYSNILGFGTNSIKLIAAKVDEKTFGNVSLVSNEEQNETPSKTKLLENYPNPFNPSTTIPIQVSSPVEVQLEIFDVMGRKVEELYKGNLTIGLHNFRFLGDNLSSGVYYYRLITNGEAKIMSMILLK